MDKNTRNVALVALFLLGAVVINPWIACLILFIDW